MSPQTVAVTGVSGYFGRLLLPLLEAETSVTRVVGIDRRPPAAGTWSKLDFHQADLRQAEFETLLDGVDVVVHLAFVLMRLPGARDLDSINVQATQRLCRAAVSCGVRKLVVTSSVVAYGLHADNPIPLTEDSPLRPNRGHYYSEAKAINENFLESLAQEQAAMVVTRLRPCTVIGPQADKGQMASMLAPTAIVVRGYDPPIQLLHEQDLAQALLLAILKDLPGVYNVTSDEPLTLRQLSALRGGRVIELPFGVVRGLLGLLWALRQSAFAPEWADLSRFPIVASNAKLKAAGWKPRYNTAQAYLSLLAAHGLAPASGGPVEGMP